MITSNLHPHVMESAQLQKHISTSQFIYTKQHILYYKIRAFGLLDKGHGVDDGRPGLHNRGVVVITSSSVHPSTLHLCPINVWSVQVLLCPSYLAVHHHGEDQSQELKQETSSLYQPIRTYETRKMEPWNTRMP